MKREHVVLVVEDDEDSREMLRELLVLEGYTVAVASNGVEAFERLDALGPSTCLIFLDLSMPVMDGWQVTERLRREGRLDGLNVVITTSASHKVPPGFSSIAKPLDPVKVLATAKACCREPE